MTVKKTLSPMDKLAGSKQSGSKQNGSMRQTYYLEIKGISGRIDIHVLEFGAAFALDNGTGGRVSNGKLASPARMYLYSGYNKVSALSNHLINHYRSLENASTYEARSNLKIPECLIGVETKQNGKVSLDTVYKLKEVQVIDANFYGDIPVMKMDFSDSEKLWKTWD